MKNRIYKGQEATEFILIAVLVFFAALMVVLFLGGQLGAFFGKDSSISKTAKNKASVYTSTSAKEYKTSLDDYSGSNTHATTNNGPAIIAEPQTLIIDGKEFTVPASTVGKIMEVYSSPALATATTGVEQVLQDIKVMAEKYNAPPQDIEVMFGSSNHVFDCSGKCNSKGDAAHTIEGKSEINMVAIKYGDNIIIRNVAQNQEDGTWGQYYQGLQLKLEGKIGANKTFTSAVTGKSTSAFGGAATNYQGGSYSSQVQVTPEGGLIFQTGAINLNHKDFVVYGSASGAQSVVKSTGKMELKFDKPQYNFSLEPAAEPTPVPEPPPANTPAPPPAQI